MIKITEENWEKLNKDYQDKVDTIKVLQSENDALEKTKEKSEKELKKVEATLSLVLEKLNASLNLLEAHGLCKTKDRVVTKFEERV